jgi:hypothetical protein
MMTTMVIMNFTPGEMGFFFCFICFYCFLMFAFMAWKVERAAWGVGLGLGAGRFVGWRGGACSSSGSVIDASGSGIDDSGSSIVD